MIFQNNKIKLGVTGFSRTGKTMFISSLTQALLSSDAWTHKKGSGPLSQFTPFELNQFSCASIRDDINTDIPQFPFRKVRDSLIYEHASWPEPTNGISTLTLELQYHKKGMIEWLNREQAIQLELVDYPGEWLVDLPMLNQTYVDWCEDIIEKAQTGARKVLSQAYFNALKGIDSDNDDEDVIERLADAWRQYLINAAEQGLVFNQPGKLLRPGNMLHSPVLRFFPLPEPFHKGKLYKKLKRRFTDYQDKVIKPFYKDYFATIDRQIVLVDILKTLELGQEAYAEVIDGLKVVLKSFKYGKGGLLDWLTGHNTTHVLFAATKADHVKRSDRKNLEMILRKMLRQIDDGNQFKSRVKHQQVMSIASIKASEDRQTVSANPQQVLYGKPEGSAEVGAYDPGNLPRDIPPDWQQLDYEFLNFLPRYMPDALDKGFPSINIGKALNFLIAESFD